MQTLDFDSKGITQHTIKTYYLLLVEDIDVDCAPPSPPLVRVDTTPPQQTKFKDRYVKSPGEISCLPGGKLYPTTKKSVEKVNAKKNLDATHFLSECLNLPLPPLSSTPQTFTYELLGSSLSMLSNCGPYQPNYSYSIPELPVSKQCKHEKELDELKERVCQFEHMTAEIQRSYVQLYNYCRRGMEEQE